MGLGAENQDSAREEVGQQKASRHDVAPEQLSQQAPAPEDLQGIAGTPVEEVSGAQMSAWDDRHLTQHQKNWMQSEAEVIDVIVTTLGAAQVKVGDVGCGNARFLRKLTALPGEYIGFDNDPVTVAGARKSFEMNANVQFPDAEDYREGLPRYTDEHGKMDLLLCLGNTLGTLGGERLEHIKTMFTHTDVLVVSVVESKRDVTHKRLEYYGNNGYDCHICWDTGTITSKEWGQSYAWSKAQLSEIADSMRAEGAGAAEVFTAPPLGLVLVLARSHDTLDAILGESMRRFEGENLNVRF
jgi:SAM-dependent methyltransferase